MGTENGSLSEKIIQARQAGKILQEQIGLGPKVDANAFMGAADVLGECAKDERFFFAGKLLLTLGAQPDIRRFVTEVLDYNFQQAINSNNPDEIARNARRAQLFGVSEESQLTKYLGAHSIEEKPDKTPSEGAATLSTPEMTEASQGTGFKLGDPRSEVDEDFQTWIDSNQETLDIFLKNLRNGLTPPGDHHVALGTVILAAGIDPSNSKFQELQSTYQEKGFDDLNKAIKKIKENLQNNKFFYTTSYGKSVPYPEKYVDWITAQWQPFLDLVHKFEESGSKNPVSDALEQHKSNLKTAAEMAKPSQTPSEGAATLSTPEQRLTPLEEAARAAEGIKSAVFEKKEVERYGKDHPGWEQRLAKASDLTAYLLVSMDAVEAAHFLMSQPNEVVDNTLKSLQELYPEKHQLIYSITQAEYRAANQINAYLADRKPETIPPETLDALYSAALEEAKKAEK